MPIATINSGSIFYSIFECIFGKCGGQILRTVRRFSEVCESSGDDEDNEPEKAEAKSEQPAPSTLAGDIIGSLAFHAPDTPQVDRSETEVLVVSRRLGLFEENRYTSLGVGACLRWAYRWCPLRLLPPLLPLSLLRRPPLARRHRCLHEGSTADADVFAQDARYNLQIAFELARQYSTERATRQAADNDKLAPCPVFKP